MKFFRRKKELPPSCPTCLAEGGHTMYCPRRYDVQIKLDSTFLKKAS